MPGLKGIFRLYIHGSVHVALALVAFLYYSMELSGESVPLSYIFTLFFGAVAGYNAIKWGAEPWKQRPAWPAPGKIIVLSGVCAVIALIAAINLSLQYWVLLGLGTLLAGSYALPVLPGFRNLRSFGASKVLIVTLVWVHLTVWIPLWDLSPFTNWDILVEAVQRGIWVSLLMLPFEIRDMETDPPELQTWPRRWGKNKTLRFVWISAAIFLMSTFLKDTYSPAEVVSKGFAAVSMVVAVKVAYSRKIPYLAAFWVEAIPIASLGLLLAMEGI